MKNKTLIRYTLCILNAGIIFIGCKKETSESELTPQQKLVGTWKIDKTSLGSASASNTGTITFNDCSTDSCTGSGYQASDNTTGGFIWKLVNNNTQIAFRDTSPNDGGYWNGTYDIVTLTKTNLTFQVNTILGLGKNECSK